MSRLGLEFVKRAASGKVIDRSATKNKKDPKTVTLSPTLAKFFQPIGPVDDQPTAQWYANEEHDRQYRHAQGE